MYYTLGYGEALPRLQLHNSILKVYKERTLQDEEKFIIIVVLVPMIFALHHTEPNHRSVHLTESLVVPLILAGSDQRWDIHELQH
jgi:hypothetical protein